MRVRKLEIYGKLNELAHNISNGLDHSLYNKVTNEIFLFLIPKISVTKTHNRITQESIK